MSRTVTNIHYELLPNGRLANLQDWDKSTGLYLAKLHSIDLNDEHWDIIDLMHDFYNDYRISPIKKLLFKNIREKLDVDKANDDYFNSLFPNGLTQATLIAGLPEAILDIEIHPPSNLKKATSTIKKRQVKYFVNQFEMNNETFKLTFHGNLQDGSQWNEEVAAFIAKHEEISLNESHWEIIHFLRKFYFKYGITPMVKLLQKHLAKKLGKEKGSEEYLYKLFPDGPARQGSRIAGLPEPQGCID